MKKAVVTGGSKNIFDYIGTLAVNIRDVSPQICDELVILHDGLSDKDINILNSVIPTRAIQYKCPVSKIKLLLNPVVRYFSPMVFSKIECFRLLKEYDTVTWIDYDMLLKEDIGELLEHNNDYRLIMNHGVPLKNMLKGDYSREDFASKYDMNYPSMVAALFTLNRNSDTDYDALCDFYYDKLQKYSKYLYLPEQALITMMIQEFGLTYDEIDETVYNVHPKDDNTGARILHSYGEVKFWNGIDNAIWNDYYAKWQGIKGK